MLIILTGESGSGKSTVQQLLRANHEVMPVIRYTTRGLRAGEIPGEDYNFVSLDQFTSMNSEGKFLECEGYSHHRWYGTATLDITHAIEDNEKWYSIVLTPNGMRKISKICEFGLLSKNIFKAHIQATLRSRVLRYIARCGDSFGFEDFAEIYGRSERDFGMFMNIDDECDITLQNDGDVQVNAIAEELYQSAIQYCKE